MRGGSGRCGHGGLEQRYRLSLQLPSHRRQDIRPNSPEPSVENGLKSDSEIMVDKITTYPIDKVRGPIGRIDDGSLKMLNVSLALILGLSSAKPI
jgi:hypothetical protein